MKQMNFFKRVAVAASGVLLALGMASAHAVPTFTVNSGALGLGGPAGTFVADAIGGTSSELLHSNLINNTHTASGWLQYDSFRLNSAALNSNVTGLNTKYTIYVTFTLQDHLASGSMNAPGSTYTLDMLTFQMWADPHSADHFIAATATSEASINNTGNDILLGSGSLIAGTSELNSLGGAGLNANTTFSLTPQGMLFFISPMPFYDLAFNGFNNTSQGVTFGPGGNIAINQSSGTTDFNNRVPEPGSLALLALGLLGVHTMSRRRKT